MGDSAPQPQAAATGEAAAQREPRSRLRQGSPAVIDASAANVYALPRPFCTLSKSAQSASRHGPSTHRRLVSWFLQEYQTYAPAA